MVRNFSINEPIKLYKMHVDDDDFGGVKKSWWYDSTVWGSVKFASHYKILHKSHILIEHGIQIAENLVFEITLRSQIKVAATDRLHWQDQTLCVVCDPIPTARRGYVIVYASIIKAE